MGSAVWQDRYQTPPTTADTLPLDLDSPNGYTFTKPLFRLCLCLFIDNQGALLCFVKNFLRNGRAHYLCQP